MFQNFPNTQSVAGVATAGIPAAAVLGHDFHLPVAYVRDKPKSHGRQNRIEGKLEKDTNCIVIEDLISTGGSSLEAVKALQTEGVNVIGVMALFSYGFDAAHKAFENDSYPLINLCDYQVLLEVALKEGYIASDQIQTLKAWRDAPDKWGS